MVGRGDRIRQHILFDNAAAADDGMLSDPCELMNGREPADVGIVLDDDVSCEGDAIRQDRVVVNDDIVRDVNIRHQQVVIADPGHHAATLRASMDGDKLSNIIAISDLGFRGFTFVLSCLEGRRRSRNTDKKHCPRRRKFSLKINVGEQPGAGADRNICPDNAIRSNLSVRGYFGAGSMIAVG